MAELSYHFRMFLDSITFFTGFYLPLRESQQKSMHQSTFELLCIVSVAYNIQ